MQKIKNYLWHLPLAIIANIIYGFPSRRLHLIGITGTDGKTTTATLLYHLLKNANYSTGLISTIEARINDQSLSTGLHTTSPSPFKLQKLLAQMAKTGLSHVVCEVTSHALDQFRFWGCHFQAAAITNTSHEHLDYHHTLSSYIQTKIKLFHLADYAIANKDDQSYQQIKQSVTNLITYSVKSPSQFQAKNVKLSPTQLSFTVNGKKFTTDSNFYYQTYNILAALALSHQLKIPDKIFQQTIKKFPSVPGRRQFVANNLGIKAVIDFAHTPAALEKTLKSLQKITPNRLIVIFGATGGRDSSKRPFMGQAVAQNSHIAILTTDDTRHEKISHINRQIEAGIPTQTSQLMPAKNLTSAKIKQIRQASRQQFIYFKTSNRQQAFNLALKIAQKGDTVVACGKGHETTILLGSTEYPWSEFEAFQTAFRKK